MSRILSFLAVTTLALGLTGCPAGDSLCDQYCDRVDECSGTDNSDTCKEGYAGVSGSARAAQEDACQLALDTLDSTCADDDDSAM